MPRHNYTPDEGEKNDGELLVETAGYVPANVKIESMIDAGRRLTDFRAGYEFQDGETIPDDYLDPTRNPGFDLADASAIKEATMQKMNQDALNQAAKASQTTSAGEIPTEPKKE